MARAYNVVDADGHILEPLDLWSNYIDPAYRDRAPRLVKGENGKERLVVDEHMVGDSRRGIGRIGAVGARQGVVAADTMEFDRMDRHFDDQGFNDSGLTTRPSELFQRNCWISFEPVEGSLKVLADYIGPNKIMWATDYPHADGFFPGAPDMVRERIKGTSPETQRGVLAGGALAFYGIN